MSFFPQGQPPPPPAPTPFSNPEVEGDMHSTNDEDKKEVDEADLAYERGMRKEIRSLYRKNYTESWKEWTPDNEKMDADRLKSSKFAVVGRWEMDTDSDSGLALHSFTVQSPILKKLLEEAFKGYKGVETKMKMKELTFQKPFHEFYYRWAQYRKILTQKGGQECDGKDEAKEHISLLNSIVEPQIVPHVEHAKEMEQQKSVTFDYLWVLFPPDCEVFSRIDRQDRIFRLTSASYIRTQCGVIFQIKAKYITYDGTDFGWTSETFQINPFEGYRAVLDLSVLPLSALEKDTRSGTVERLEERGKRFENFKGWHYMSYSGFVEPADLHLRKQKVRTAHCFIQMND